MFKISPSIVRSALKAILIFLAAALTFGCQSSDRTARAIALEKDVRKLSVSAEAFCRLDTLDVEGSATLAAHAHGGRTDTLQEDVAKLSSDYSRRYLRELEKLKKYPRSDVENQLRHSGMKYLAAMGMQDLLPTVLRHLNRVYLGMPLTAADVIQDFQSLRYQLIFPDLPANHNKPPH